MSREKDKLVSVVELAKAHRANVAWTASWLSRLGIDVDTSGRFRARDLHRVLDRVPDVVGSSGKVNVDARLAMGRSQESARQWLIAQFEKHGLKLAHRSERRGSRLTLQRPDEKFLWVASYVGLTTKTAGTQVGFTVTQGESGHIYPWCAFCAVPFGKAYLLSYEDVNKRWVARHGPTPIGRMTLTFSAGNDVDLFENRIEGLKASSRWK